jgi:hypothetical protein
MDFKNTDWNKAVQNTLADYEKAKTSATFTERKEVDLRKYFTLALPESKNSGEMVFRIMPISIDENGVPKWYETAKFHNLKIGKKWSKLYDPEQDGEESPLNVAYRSLMKSGEKEDKTLAISYKSRDFYIVRGIDRSKEHEGVKFWRFPKPNDGSGIMDKITPMIKRLNEKNPGSGAFYNPSAAGRDLVINVVRDLSKGYTKVSQIMFDEPSALSNDENLANEWLNDATTWRDLYKKKSLEYLEIVAQGGEPVWDGEAKKFVAKADDYQVQTYSAPSQTTVYREPSDLMSGDINQNPITVDTEDLPF